MKIKHRDTEVTESAAHGSLCLCVSNLGGQIFPITPRISCIENFVNNMTAGHASSKIIQAENKTQRHRGHRVGGALLSVPLCFNRVHSISVPVIAKPNSRGRSLFATTCQSFRDRTEIKHRGTEDTEPATHCTLYLCVSIHRRGQAYYETPHISQDENYFKNLTFTIVNTSTLPRSILCISSRSVSQQIILRNIHD